MKRTLAAVTVILLLAGGLFLFHHSRTPAPDLPPQVVASAPPTNMSPSVGSLAPMAAGTNVPSQPNGRPVDLSARAGQVMPDTNPAPLLPPQTVLQNLHRAVHEYGQMFGGNPVGTNPEITAALAGHNPKGINFLRDDPGMTVNANGELIDPWGTPYFFHQISGSDMELHSAGPDRIMWTPDDLVIK